MNWHRKERPRRARQRPLVEVPTEASDSLDGAVRAQHRDTVRQLYRAIHQLAKADAALVLMYLEGLSYREMSDVLGISENHVGVKLNRAKKTLGTLMNGESRDS